MTNEVDSTKLSFRECLIGRALQGAALQEGLELRKAAERAIQIVDAVEEIEEERRKLSVERKVRGIFKGFDPLSKPPDAREVLEAVLKTAKDLGYSTHERDAATQHVFRESGSSEYVVVSVDKSGLHLKGQPDPQIRFSHEDGIWVEDASAGPRRSAEEVIAQAIVAALRKA